MRNSTLKLINAISLCFLFFVPINLIAAGFDQNLEKVAELRKKKNLTGLLTLLEKNNSSPELEDLRLFLIAESLKSLGNKERALHSYETLLNKFPESEVAFQSRLPHFLLLLENANEAALPKLEGIARALPTSWQRGTALEKLANLDFVKQGKRSRLALMAIREFHSEKPFYKTIPASHDILKKVLTNPDKFLLEDDEWLEIFILASEEGLTSDFFKKNKNPSGILGKWGAPALDVFKAINLAKDKKNLKEAQALLAKTIANGKANAAIRAFAHQARADLNYQATDYESAVIDYRAALENPIFPVNERACQYRLMRSTFFTGRDSECLELLGRLAKVKESEPLLPGQIYDMALERFDNNRMASSVPLFMFLARNFPGHYRADDAIGYSILSLGREGKEGQTLLKLLKKKYPNSFFVYWIAPEAHDTTLPAKKYKDGKLTSNTANRLKAWKKLWKTDFASFSREEARKMTDKYPCNMALYKGIIDTCKEAGDYNQLTAYGERLVRQLLEGEKFLAEMPLWAWKAHYPEAYFKEVKLNADSNKIDPYWVLSIMREESHFNPETLSRSNAMGLMQILPSTGKWIAQKAGQRKFDKNLLWKPEINIRFGCWYLKYLSDLFNGDLFLASASYNGGQGNIQRKVEKGLFAHLGVLERLDKVPLPETRDYFKKVMGSYWNYKRLYQKKK